MKLHEILQIGTAIVSIIAVLWQLSDFKSQVFKYIDAAIYNANNRINDNEKKFDIFISRYEERKEFVDYQFHGLNEVIAHKFQRCMDEIKSLKKQ
jgi:hypothetical protein